MMAYRRADGDLMMQSCHLYASTTFNDLTCQGNITINFIRAVVFPHYIVSKTIHYQIYKQVMFSWNYFTAAQLYFHILMAQGYVKNNNSQATRFRALHWSKTDFKYWADEKTDKAQSYMYVIQSQLIYMMNKENIWFWVHWQRQHSRLIIMEWTHDDVIKWKHFPRDWPFVRGIHRSPVNSPHKGQWRGALMFSLIRV